MKNTPIDITNNVRADTGSCGSIRAAALLITPAYRLSAAPNTHLQNFLTAMSNMV